MIVTVTPEAPRSTTASLLATAASLGLSARTLADDRGGAVVGIDGSLPADALTLPGIDQVHTKHRPYMLASNEHRQGTVVRVGHVAIGGGRPVLMAGPCVVEGRDEIIEAARAVKAAGAEILRGGAFKPRTSPYAFQGLGEEGLRCLAAAREATGLPVVTEVLEPDQVELVAEYADMLQIGARNMANFPLLRRVGKIDKPVLLKRGFSATVEEWLMSAEYILAGGNADVVLCERGIRGFDPAFRFNLDLNAVPLAKELSHLPVIVDPSHGTGRRSLVHRMSLAGLAAGADGLIVEVHPNPEAARCDASQTITPAELARIYRQGLALHAALAEEEAGIYALDEVLLSA
ncbi:MAG: 3-deoxy-7-phosphoheptulonate synthase [Thermomicrobiales bacterium]|jgi:3-deoxy-7-phosphoheptulonate synthase|nr:3-deoxy-7-phosphoheptulonate synthase [Thermomicrobiales bacterium]